MNRFDWNMTESSLLFTTHHQASAGNWLIHLIIFNEFSAMLWGFLVRYRDLFKSKGLFDFLSKYLHNFGIFLSINESFSIISRYLTVSEWRKLVSKKIFFRFNQIVEWNDGMCTNIIWGIALLTWFVTTTWNIFQLRKIILVCFWRRNFIIILKQINLHIWMISLPYMLRKQFKSYNLIVILINNAIVSTSRLLPPNYTQDIHFQSFKALFPACIVTKQLPLRAP